MAKNCIKEPEVRQSEAGLADVVACQSDICFIDGDNCRLVYRGYNALDLALNSNFEEVAYLLWYGCLPRITEYKAFLAGFTGSMSLPSNTVMILRMFPKSVTPMEVLRHRGLLPGALGPGQRQYRPRRLSAQGSAPDPAHAAADRRAPAPSRGQ